MSGSVTGGSGHAGGQTLLTSTSSVGGGGGTNSPTPSSHSDEGGSSPATISQRDVVIRLFMNNENEVVDLSHIDMSSSNLFKFCQCLKNQKLSRNKREFNLSLCNIDEKKFSLIFEALSTLTHEFSLTLNFNKLNNTSIALLDVKRIFSDLVKLKILSLDGTSLGNQGMIELATHIPMSKSLCHLSLESNRLGLEGMMAIAKILPATPSLKSINLRGNDLSEEKSVQVLCHGIGQSQVEVVNLEMTNIQPLAVRHIGSLLSQSRSLTSLDLSSNHLLPHGMRFIADGLKENLVLNSLRLAGCFIGVSGLTYLTAGLVDNDTLRSLDLSRIHSSEEAFGEEGGKPIADMLTLNRGITNLNLYWQCLGTKGAISIAIALDSNRTIKTLNLGGNYIAPEGVRRLESALGLSEKLANDRPISSWLGSSPLTPLLLNRHSAYLRRLSHGSGTPQLSRGNSFAATPRSGTVSRANSFNTSPMSRGNSSNNISSMRKNSGRNSFKEINIPRLSTTPRTGGDSASSVWVPLSPNSEVMKTRQPSARNLRNTITDPQARRRTSQFFESSFTGGATDDFLTRRSSIAPNAQQQQQQQQQQQYGTLSSKRRGSQFPRLSTGIGSPIIAPLLPTSILPPALQGPLSSSTSTAPASVTAAATSASPATAIATDKTK